MVQLADGRAVRAGLLIGADGIKSVVRQQLFPHVTLRYSGYTAWRGVCDQADVTPGIMSDLEAERHHGSQGRGFRHHAHQRQASLLVCHRQ